MESLLAKCLPKSGLLTMPKPLGVSSKLLTGGIVGHTLVMEHVELRELNLGTKCMMPTLEQVGNPYDLAEIMFKQVGLDYASTMAYFERFGYIYSGPKFLLLYEHIKLHKMETWACFLAIGKGYLPIFLESIPYWLDYFSFARWGSSRHEARTLPMERVCRLYGLDTEHLKKRKRC